MNTIEIKNLNKKIKGAEVLKDINLHLEGGKVYGLKGKNGSGKTMLMRAVCGLILPTGGSITINGEQLGKQISFPRSVGILIENPSFIPGYTGLKNLSVLAAIQKRVGEDEIRETLEKIGLDPDDKRTYRKYSLGMKQRIGIAMALLGDPLLLILDEPINGLDADGMRIMREVLVDITKNKGCTVIISSHLLGELEKIATHYGIIRGGKMLCEMTAEELEADCPTYTALRVKDTNRARRSRPASIPAWRKMQPAIFAFMTMRCQRISRLVFTKTESPSVN